MNKYIVFFVLRAKIKLYTIDPILPFLEEAGYRVILVHANSLIDDTSMNILGENVEYIDLNTSGVKTVIKRISSINCIGCVSIGFKSLFDILCLNIAHQLELKTIYLEHGLFMPVLGNKYHFKLNSSLKRYVCLFLKYLAYIRTFKINPLKEFKSLYSSFVKNNFTKIRHDYALFYTEKGKELVNHYFEFSDQDVFYSGYPIVSKKSDLLLENKGIEKENIALYIHQPLIKDGIVNCSYKEEKELLISISQRLADENYQMIVKLHPRESLYEYESRFEGTDVSFSTTPLFELMTKSKIVIGQFSTALFYAIKQRIPIIILPYNGLDKEYYSIFEKIGCVNPDDVALKHLLKQSQEDKTNQMLKYIEFEGDYIGDNNSSEDQAGCLINILSLPKKK